MKEAFKSMLIMRTAKLGMTVEIDDFPPGEPHILIEYQPAQIVCVAETLREAIMWLDGYEACKLLSNTN